MGAPSLRSWRLRRWYVDLAGPAIRGSRSSRRGVRLLRLGVGLADPDLRGSRSGQRGVARQRSGDLVRWRLLVAGGIILLARDAVASGVAEGVREWFPCEAVRALGRGCARGWLSLAGWAWRVLEEPVQFVF